MKYLIAFILLFLATPAHALDYAQTNCGDADAVTFCAATCSRADVLAAYNATTSNATVYVPSGTCNWSGGTATAITVTKSNISFIGAGAGQTVISVDYLANPTLLWQYHAATGSSTFWQISGFTFNGALDCTNGDSCYAMQIVYGYQSQNFRFDHNVVDGYWWQFLQVKSINKGLVDNNVFTNRKVVATGSYYGAGVGSPYDGSPGPNDMDICSKTSTPDFQCNCQAGMPSTDRASSVAASNTAIPGGSYSVVGQTYAATADLKYNGSADTGTVRRITAYIDSVGSNPTITVASFSRSGDVFTGHARSAAIPVAVGSNVLSVDDGDFSAFAINDGEYLGAYLSNCALSADTGSTGWVVSGDQTAGTDVDFGAADIGGVSLWAELYDDTGRYAACEAEWAAWYQDEATRSPHFKAFNAAWTYSEDAIYFEDNHWSWTKSGEYANWGGSARVVVRYNTFDTYTGSVTWMKPGNNYGVWHNNQINYTGAGSTAYVHFLESNALVYNNTYNGYNKIGSPSSYREFSDFYFPFLVRPKEIFSWGNTCTDCTAGCVTGGDETNCWYPLSGGYEGIYWWAGSGENGVFHGRAPQSGDRLYSAASCLASRSATSVYGVTTPSAGCYVAEYAYPHPLRGESAAANGITLGSGSNVTLGSGSGAITLQ